jgi:3-phenylpropionate/trans-cinnamate dioxygenase ferredoxin reductase subunit
MTKTLSSILIVGAGQASAVAAATLRDEGFEGKITIVGDEAHAPYERPPLSKEVLAATPENEPAIDVKPVDFYSIADIDLRLGLKVESIDPAAGTAKLSDDSQVVFDQCLLTTGGKARFIEAFPEDAPGVFYLRTLDDARALRTALKYSKHLAVIGGGFLGLEVASTAHNMGVAVSIIEATDRVLGRVTPPQFSNWLQQRIVHTGLSLHLGKTPAAIAPPTSIKASWDIRLPDNHHVVADTVMVSVGLSANNALARQAGLNVDPNNGGILVNEQCQTSSPNIYAAGDCTSQIRGNAGHALRLESWQNANEQARIAATHILGKAPSPAAYPWFWTDQFGCNIQMLGLPEADLTYVTRGELDPESKTPKFIMLGLKNNVPRYAIAVNAGGDLRALRALFEKRASINPNEFIDTSVTARAFAKSAMATHNAG